MLTKEGGREDIDRLALGEQPKGTKDISLKGKRERIIRGTWYRAAQRLMRRRKEKSKA